jgi:hypothetical protein
MTAVVMTAVVATATCCGSMAVAAPCGASLVAAAALPAARGALDERRLVGTAASDLSTLADVRGVTVGVTLRMQRQKNQTLAPRGRGVWGAIVYLRVEKLLTVKIYQPSHEFTFGVGISFIPYPLVLTPVV